MVPRPTHGDDFPPLVSQEGLLTISHSAVSNKKKQKLSVEDYAERCRFLREQEEGLEILHGIDTQWGTLPQGGAYGLFWY